jgi:hypothetical protein
VTAAIGNGRPNQTSTTQIGTRMVHYLLTRRLEGVNALVVPTLGGAARLGKFLQPHCRRNGRLPCSLWPLGAA